MSKYIINSTFGEFSAGTEVVIVGEGDDPTDGKLYTVHPINAPFDTAFDIPQSMITRRRNRTEEITVPTREERRANDRSQSEATDGSSEV